MSQLNIGERYFALRDQISQVINGITELAYDTSADLEAIFSKGAIERDLGAPFLFLVCGEVNAGKSSLINSLFGRELCKVSNLPETDSFILYRYGTSPQDLSTTPTLQERYRPIEFLREFNLMDTPGTNSSVSGHHEIIEQFLPVTDLLLFVFPVANPWGAATWNVISTLPAECHHRVAFIIQQADQREAADISVIVEHMAELSRKRIGIVPPIFAVSGKLAMEAKQSGAFNGRELERSGLPVLESYISHSIYESPKRRAALQRWRNNATIALGIIEDKVEDQSRILDDQNRFLAGIEDEIDGLREGLVDRLPHNLTALAEAFEKEAAIVSKTLWKWMGITRSSLGIFLGDRTGSKTEALLIERLRFAVEAVAQSDGKDVVAACQAHWQDLGMRVKESLGKGIDEEEPIADKLDRARQRFVDGIGRAAQICIGNLRVRKGLERELRRRNLALKSFTATTLIFLIFGALSGILRLPRIPLIFCGVGFAFALAGFIIAIATRQRIARDFKISLLDTCGPFAEALRVDYEEALRIFFQDYMTCLNSIRKHLAMQKSAIEPQLARWQNLFLTLKSIEQED